jgi:fluoroacetyl-CoA thioesterase
MSPDLRPGLTFEWQYHVPERATVPGLFHDTSFCRDMPPVLATGYLVGLMELACTNGIMPYVDWPREQSVGIHVSFSHIAATPPGMLLTFKGEVIEVQVRRVKFRIEAWDDVDKISEGVHERAIIDTERFNIKLAGKKAAAGLA